MNHTAGYVKLVQAVQWKAEGKQVEMKWGDGPWEMFPQDLTHAGASEVLRGNDEVDFRIKPRTVKIGNREVEAPVLEPTEGQELWSWDSRGLEPACWKFSSKNVLGVEQVMCGYWFASSEACKAAYDAYCAALRGEA